MVGPEKRSHASLYYVINPLDAYGTLLPCLSGAAANLSERARIELCVSAVARMCTSLRDCESVSTEHLNSEVRSSGVRSSAERREELGGCVVEDPDANSSFQL
ncbi:MAG: hypothetical protein ACJA14_001480 [Ilumatobacter sp.]|jgi:hypothetical protein